MVEMTEKISTHLLLVEPITINLVGRQDAIKDIFVFLCLWPPVIIEECDISSFSATMSDIWGMKEHVLVWEEDNRVFIFQLKEDESKNHAHHGARELPAMLESRSAATEVTVGLTKNEVAQVGLSFTMPTVDFYGFVALNRAGSLTN
ncbi:hypothetical protein ACLB2K_062647 [Fragaria x ananassa]